MFKWLFGEKCEHDFKIIDTYTKSFVGEYGEWKHYSKYVLYCPKCEKEKHVYKKDYDRKLTKERLRKQYTKGD